MAPKVLEILNHLKGRQAVPRNELMHDLGVSERSFYRYISQLSSAKIPVYFDQSEGGYKLRGGSNSPARTLDDPEVLLLRLGLELLAEHLGDVHAEAIGSAVRALDQLSPSTAHSALLPTTENPSQGQPRLDLVISSNYNIISHAIAKKRSVTLRYVGPSGLKSGRKLRVPALGHASTWYAHDMADKVGQKIPLDSVVEATIGEASPSINITSTE